MSDADRSAAAAVGATGGPPERLPAYNGFAADDAEERPASDFPSSLVSLRFITAALRRSAWLWCALAVAGFLIGIGVYVELPPAYQATTSVLLAPPPGQDVTDSILTDVALAQTRTVAGLTLHQLGLRESANSFLGTYTATEITDRVLLLTVNAPSSSAAVSRASALATEFLRYRAARLENTQQQVLLSLNQQINQARQHVGSIRAQVSQVSAQPASPAQAARLTALRTEFSSASAALTALEQTTYAEQASTQAAITSTIKGSGVLDPAVPTLRTRTSRLKHLLIYAATGLIAGLALGMGIVIVQALVSDRLRTRDDIASALGAPVKLSVGPVRLRRAGRPGRRGLAAGQPAAVRRIATYLGGVVAARSRGTGALAVVPVDDQQAAAAALVSLAVSCAREGGLQVIVADLSGSLPAARLLGAGEAGVHTVSVDGAGLVVVVPDRDDPAPIGPLGQAPASAQAAPCGAELAAAFASADLLLTLVALDPSAGGEHLATWAADAVVMVTAGRSSWTKIHAVGEMIRLAGPRLVAAVLVGADKADESLGVPDTPGAGADGSRAGEVPEPDAGGLVRVDGGADGRAASPAHDSR